MHAGEGSAAAPAPAPAPAPALPPALPPAPPQRAGAYFCDVPGCGVRAPSASALSVHMRMHTGELPFACVAGGCGYATAQLEALLAHVSRVHPGGAGGEA